VVTDAVNSRGSGWALRLLDGHIAGDSSVASRDVFSLLDVFRLFVTA
jgi:hypothetical protein